MPSESIPADSGDPSKFLCKGCACRLRDLQVQSMLGSMEYSRWCREGYCSFTCFQKHQEQRPIIKRPDGADNESIKNQTDQPQHSGSAVAPLSLGSGLKVKPRRVIVFAGQLVGGLPLRCLILAAMLLAVRMTLMEYWASGSRVAVGAAISESHNFYDSNGVPPFIILMGSMKPHSWLWGHVHIDKLEYSISSRGMMAVDGSDVEDFLKSVAYSAPTSGDAHAALVLFNGLAHQQRLHRLMLWGVCMELAALSIVSAAMVMAWQDSGTHMKSGSPHRYEGIKLWEET